jgi:Helix-turn-helix of DDE superfamily endonuclease
MIIRGIEEYMLRYCDICNDEGEFLAMTGLTVHEFNQLLPDFHDCFEAHLQMNTIDGYERQHRRYSPYRNRTFPMIEDMLLFILVCVKQYPTQTLLGRLFGMKQPQANRWIHLLHPILNCALERAGCRPERAALVQLSVEADDTTTEKDIPLLSIMAVSDP